MASIGRLVVFAAAIIAATPVVILSPLVIATPILVFTPLLARTDGPVNIVHVKTEFARNDGGLKAFPELTLSPASRTFSLSTRRLFLPPNISEEYYAPRRSDHSDPE